MTREKGLSLIELPDNYVAIDIETTGLDPCYDEIIEVGAVRFQNSVAVDSFSTLVKPLNEINDFITELTGIKNEDLVSSPSLQDILPNFISFIENDILVAHNAHFDVNFLYDACLETCDHILSNNIVDTMRLSRLLLPELKNHRLSTVVRYFEISQDVPHRALHDCVLASRCLSSLQSKAIELYGSIENFKEHRGKKKYKINANDITTNLTAFDESHLLFEKVCVFTGILEKMARKEAMQYVVDKGGMVSNGVTAKTNFLILGNNDYCATIKDGKSSKQKKAEKYKLEGKDIEIISENVFYSLVGL